MNYFGIYHSDYTRSGSGIFDAPCITKGRMTLCAYGVESSGGKLAAAFGRLRNRAALTGELGCAASTSAAGMVLLAYERWGCDYPRHFEGPVVTCLLDAAEDTLVLSRDRMGEQSVFYVQGEKRVAFSDHPDALLKAAHAEPVMDAGGARELFGLGPARTPGRTFYRDIRALEPGCALAVRGGHAAVERYFHIEDVPHEDDAPETTARVRGMLEQSVDDITSLRPAVMLSGGLDSTALTALLKRRDNQLRSFSVDYQDNARDFRANAFRPEMDAPYVLEAVRAFGTQHRAVTLDQASLAESLDRAVSLRGFPGMADIDTSLLLFSREIARYNRYVVSGECGDEVFGGYPWFRGEAPLDGFPWSGSLALRESLLRPEIGKRLNLSEYVRDTFETRRKAADPGPSYEPKERRLRAMQRLCFDYFMANLQERAARMCEGAGIHVLTPLCDDRLVQYVYNVPWEMKFMGGQEKGLFRAAVSDLLPEKLLKRTKSPYPKTCSPAYGRIVRGMALRMAADDTAPLFEIVDPKRLVDLSESELNPADTPWYGQLMSGAQLLGFLWQVNRWMRDRNISIRL